LAANSQITVRKDVVKKMRNLKNQLLWEEIGPSIYPGTENERGLTGTGPIKYFDIHKIDENYCAANSIFGGLFLSTDQGENWFKSGSDQWDRSMCSWFAFHPQDPNIVVALSIEEATMNGGKVGLKGGVELTFDFGKTWVKIGDYHDFEDDPHAWIFKVILTEDNKCYVATSRGLFYLDDITNRKSSWRNVIPRTILKDIEPFGSDLLISGKTIDGSNWFIKKMSLKNPSKVSDLGIKVDPMGLSYVKFEVVRGQKNHFHYVAQYEKKPDFLVKSNLRGDQEVLYDQMRAVFGAGLSLAISPDDPNIVFAGYGVSMQKSLDGGKTWKHAAGKYHVDIEGMMFHPKRKNELYIFTHGGLYRSKDLGETWENWSNGIGNAEVMGMGVGYDGFPVAIGLFHDGSMVWSKDSTWKHKESGDGLNSYVAWDSSQYVYISNQHRVGGLFASKDSGQTFINISKTSKFKTSGWSMSFVQNTKKGEVFYFNYGRSRGDGMSEGYDIVMSTNRGFSDYHIISDFYKTHGFDRYNLYDLFVNPNMPGTVYTYMLLSDSGTLQHKLFKNDSTLSHNYEDIKNHWVEVELPKDDWIGDIEFNPLKKEEMLVVYGSKDRFSNDDDYGTEMVYRVNLEKKVNCYTGKNCKDITWNLPNAYVDKLASFVDYDRNRIYVGTNEGLYYLDLEEMDEWKKLGKSLPNVIIRQIQISGDRKWIFVGTKGRGVWRRSNN
jgi:photosystem II stability/assembly factor-like uncharacterized protein